MEAYHLTLKLTIFNMGPYAHSVIFKVIGKDRSVTGEKSVSLAASVLAF